MMSPLAFRSHLRDIAWPALPDDLAAPALALQYQFLDTERLPAEEIADLQFRQIEELVNFCHASVPFWRDRLRKAGLRPGQKITPQLWQRLPILTRQEAQAAGARLNAPRPPPEHGRVYPGATSDPTGMKLSILRTDLTNAFSLAGNLRLALWHGFDLGAKLAISRMLRPGPAVPVQVEHAPHWGEGYEAFATGPSIRFDIRMPPARQVEILASEQAAYLVTSPTNAAELARFCQDSGRKLPTLRAINIHGEELSEDARGLCAQAFGVPIIHAYSAEECGFLTLQCPHGRQHVMAETTKSEVLDAAARPCAPGQTGRVVITQLHNFATPLLRYDLGVIAEPGGTCACGRSLPVLKRILGRGLSQAARPSRT